MAIAFLLLLFHSVAAQPLFRGPIRFKGQAEGTHFRGQEFDINLVGSDFKIAGHEEGSKGKVFLVEFNDNSIKDLVFSPNRTAIAVATDTTEWEKSRMSLITVNAAGKERVHSYQARQMTQRLGWVVELGAVSDNGELILAKCALMLPADKSGVAYVRHEWVVLKIENEAIEIVDSMNAIDKWTDHVARLAEKARRE